MGEERYLYTDEGDEAELARLALQASVFDPVTTRRLEKIGVAQGWKCLEVAAGAGSIAEWLSGRVGPSGRVVATDIDLRFLKRLSAPNLEIRRHDILKDELEKDEYDLVHSRKFLQHLHDPEKALRRMSDAVRPGGWILIEEDDWGSTLSMDITNPALSPLVTGYRRVLEALAEKGIADGYLGRRVRDLVERLGYTDVGQEGWNCILRANDPLTRVIEAGWPALVAADLASQDEVESWRRLYHSPDIYWPSYTLFAACGRKPVQGSRGEVGGDD